MRAGWRRIVFGTVAASLTIAFSGAAQYSPVEREVGVEAGDPGLSQAEVDEHFLDCLNLPEIAPELPGAPRVGPDEPMNQNVMNCFAWQEFIALNWQASAEHSGQADLSVPASQFGDPGATTPVVWENLQGSVRGIPAERRDAFVVGRGTGHPGDLSGCRRRRSTRSAVVREVLGRGPGAGRVRSGERVGIGSERLANSAERSPGALRGADERGRVRLHRRARVLQRPEAVRGGPGTRSRTAGRASTSRLERRSRKARSKSKVPGSSSTIQVSRTAT